MILGCSAAPPDGGGAADTGRVTDPSAYSPEVGGADRAPDRPLDELSAMAQVAVDAALGLHGNGVFAAYDVAMDGADAACPEQATYGSNRFWDSDCTSSKNATFDGYVTQLVYAGLPIDDGYYTGWGLIGALVITEEDGREFVGHGYVYTLAGQTSTGEHTWAEINGQFAWSGEETAGTWVEDGLAPHVRIDARRDAATGAREVAIDGSVTLDATVTVDYEALYLSSGSACPTEPEGAFALREVDGTWYVVTFDPAGTCDGCGAATREGRSLGLVCVDVARLLDWSTRPW